MSPADESVELQVVDRFAVHLAAAHPAEGVAGRGVELADPGYTASQRIDLFMVRAWSGAPKRHERHAIEIKVSRSDLLHELPRPEKRAPYEAVAHRFLFATPKSLVRAGELPDGCGLLEVGDSGYCHLVTRGERRTPSGVPHGAFVEAFRRAGRAETRIRTADGGPEEVARLRRELASARAAEERAKSGKRVADDRVRSLLRVVGEHVTVSCSQCETPLTAKRRRSHGIEWVHTEETRCAWPDPNVDTVVPIGTTSCPSPTTGATP